jgi:hypothetical protein
MVMSGDGQYRVDGHPLDGWHVTFVPTHQEVAWYPHHEGMDAVAALRRYLGKENELS